MGKKFVLHFKKRFSQKERIASPPTYRGWGDCASQTGMHNKRINSDMLSIKDIFQEKSSKLDSLSLTFAFTLVSF